MKIFCYVGNAILSLPLPFLIYASLVNITAFFFYASDKKRAIKKKTRIPEASLLAFSYVGGGLGSLFGMSLCRHKTLKTRFKVIVPLFFILYTVFIFLSIIFALHSSYGT